jgi:RNA polymerase sigma-70 factor (ECF subfamily)
MQRNEVHTGEPRDAASDEELIRGFLAGQAAAFDRLVHRYATEVFNFVVRFVGSSAAAEDVVQDTFLQVHQSAGGFDRDRRFKPWLFTIAANKARDHLRSRARKRERPVDAGGAGPAEGQSLLDVLSDPGPSPEQEVEIVELQHLVRDIVDEMPDHLREILILGYYQRFPYRDIAEVLDIPLGTVKSRLHAAVAHFATLYRRRTQKGR